MPGKTNKSQIANVFKLIRSKLENYIKSSAFQDAYDYIDSTEMYNDLKSAGLDASYFDIDSEAWKDSILEIFADSFYFNDQKSHEYMKSICKQLGLDKGSNPFIVFFNNFPKYTFDSKDIIALNNAYSRNYINDKMLLYNKPDKRDIGNILYFESLYKRNTKPQEILDTIKASRDFQVDDENDLKDYLNIFYDASGDVNSWTTIKKNLEDYKINDKNSNYQKKLDIVDDDAADNAARAISKLNQDDLTDTIKRELYRRAKKSPDYVSDLINNLMITNFNLKKKS